ncbi:MAG: hypothetical protein AB8B51_03095 [Sedimentitalea sp.]
MFRLVRTVFLILLAFVAGTFYERDRMKTLCVTADGAWRSNLCVGSSQ